MSLKKRPEFLDLEKDLPTTREDISALRRARSRTGMDLSRYLWTLSRMRFPKDFRSRSKTHEGFEPFEL
jgi:hypothetical protein